MYLSYEWTHIMLTAQYFLGVMESSGFTISTLHLHRADTRNTATGSLSQLSKATEATLGLMAGKNVVHSLQW